MRISDWSSDVCSSDLPVLDVGFRQRHLRRHAVDDAAERRPVAFAPGGDAEQLAVSVVGHVSGYSGFLPPSDSSSSATLAAWRSEEHTSELQSLMRISYAVFCLKKKTKSRKQ